MTDQAITFDTAVLDPAELDTMTLRTVRSTGVYRVMQSDGRFKIIGPRTLQRQAEYRARRAKLGTDEGRNDLVDACRVWAGMAMVRRANLDRKRGVRR